MGNPMPSQGRTDPGIRNQIFTSTYQNSDGYYALNIDFLTANVMIKCDGSWSSEVQDNFNQYVRGKYLTFQLHTAGKYLNVSQAPILDYRIWSSDPGNGYQVKWRWRLIKHKKSKKKSIQQVLWWGRNWPGSVSSNFVFPRRRKLQIRVEDEGFLHQGGRIHCSV